MSITGYEMSTGYTYILSVKTILIKIHGIIKNSATIFLLLFSKKINEVLPYFPGMCKNIFFHYMRTFTFSNIFKWFKLWSDWEVLINQQAIFGIWQDNRFTVCSLVLCGRCHGRLTISYIIIDLSITVIVEKKFYF